MSSVGRGVPFEPAIASLVDNRRRFDACLLGWTRSVAAMGIAFLILTKELLLY